VAGEEVPWPPPPREPGPWSGGPPVSPPGNTPLPPLPGAGGVVHGAAAQANPWANPGGSPESLTGPNKAPMPGFAPQGGPQRSDPFPGLPSGPALRDRAPAWVLVVSGVIVLALIAGAAVLVLKGGRQYPSEWNPRVAPITSWVSKERELEFTHPVQVNFLTDKEYTARSTEGGDDDSVESQQYYADQLAQLRALGFVTGDVDLAKANDTLSDSGTLAYYDPDLEQVFVRGTELTPAVRVTLAHELTHVLQDQNFDLQRLDDLSTGQATVLRALAEGDATKVEDAYVETLSKADKASYDKETKESGDQATEDLDKDVPSILTTIFASPYILGPRFVDYLDAKGGWKAINEALQDPPTEEAMFDPITYDTDAAAKKTVTIDPPEGAEVIETDEFGPTTWFLLLASRMDPKNALAAVDGWGGDQYVVYRKDDKVCLNATIDGDTPQDETEMAQALTSWAAKSPAGTTEVTADDDGVHFHSCDPGKDAKAVGDEVTPDTLGLPVVRTDIYTEAIAADQTPKQSACFAKGILKVFTVDQLLDPKGAFVNSDEGQQALATVRQDCFD